jgi:hypothetical protein
MRLVKFVTVRTGEFHFERVKYIVRHKYTEIGHVKPCHFVDNILCLKFLVGVLCVRVIFDRFGVNIELDFCTGRVKLIPFFDGNKERYFGGKDTIVFDFVFDMGVVKLDIIRGPKVLTFSQNHVG